MTKSETPIPVGTQEPTGIQWLAFVTFPDGEPKVKQCYAQPYIQPEVARIEELPHD